MGHQQKYFIALCVLLDTLGVHYNTYKLQAVTLHELKGRPMSSHTAVIDIFVPVDGHDFSILEAAASSEKFSGDLVELARFLERCPNLINQR